MPRIPSGSEKQLLRLVESKVQKIERAIDALLNDTYPIGEALGVLNERGLYGPDLLRRSMMYLGKVREELIKAQHLLKDV